MGKTYADVRDELLKRIDGKTYPLVYVDYRDELSDKSVAAIVKGDYETLDEENWEWESDSRDESAKTIIEELFQEIDDLEFDFDEFFGTEEYDEVRFAVEDRDDSEPYKQLCRNTGNTLLRIEAIGEDNGWAFQEVTPAQILDQIGFERSEHNVKAIDKCLLEVSPEFGVTMGYWVIGADIEVLYNLPVREGDYEVEIVNPFLFLGNPFSGRGWITEVALEGIVTVQRSDLRSDKDAFGYSVQEIFGHPSASDFDAEIRIKS